MNRNRELALWMGGVGVLGTVLFVTNKGNAAVYDLILGIFLYWVAIIRLWSK